MDEVLSLPPEDRLELMDRIWDSLSEDPESIPVPEEHREILATRLKAYRADPSDVVPWEAVRSRYANAR